MDAIPYFIVTGQEPDAWDYHNRERIVAVSTWGEAISEKAEAEAYGWLNVEIEQHYYEPMHYEWEDEYTNA